METYMDEPTENLTKDFYIKFGLLFGIVGIVYSLISYLAGIGFMSSGWNSFLNFAILFGMMYYIGVIARRFLGGFIPFKIAFRAIFLTSLLGAFLYVLFQFVLNTMIDPDLMSRLMDYSLQEQMAKFEAQGMSDEQIDQMMAMTEKMTSYMKYRYTLIGFIAEYLVSGLLLAIPSLIVAAIIKKQPPIPFSLDE